MLLAAWNVALVAHLKAIGMAAWVGFIQISTGKESRSLAQWQIGVLDVPADECLEGLHPELCYLARV
eukprot:1146305-Pelagomonas_calceolata.AAC.5